MTLLVALTGAALVATGREVLMNWGTGIFVLARFLDHFDGELARATGRTSRSGYYMDYLAGFASYAALFAGIALGVSNSLAPGAAAALALVGGVSALLVMLLDFRLDAIGDDGAASGYPVWGGFELEDGIYLLAPITWLGYLHWFFIVAAIGAAMFALWTFIRVLTIHSTPG